MPAAATPDFRVVVPNDGPPLPMGRRVELPGRGTTFFREIPGPEGAPTVVLLHGWLASAGLNWFTCFPELVGRYRVIAPDLRGHGRGIKGRRRFTLADCADDVAALLEHLDTGPAIIAGYSLGGPVAQLLWRRHPELVDGLVLCATSHHLMPGMREQAIFGTFMLAAAGSTRIGQAVTRSSVATFGRLLPTRTPARPRDMRAWARGEMRRHDYRHVLEAGVALSTYHARWIDEIDVPTVVVVTTKDRAINPLAQARMAFKIPDASIHRLDDGHIVCVKEAFGPALREALDEVAERASATSPE